VGEGVGIEEGGRRRIEGGCSRDAADGVDCRM